MSERYTEHGNKRSALQTQRPRVEGGRNEEMFWGKVLICRNSRTKRFRGARGKSVSGARSRLRAVRRARNTYFVYTPATSRDVFYPAGAIQQHFNYVRRHMLLQVERNKEKKQSGFKYRGNKEMDPPIGSQDLLGHATIKKVQTYKKINKLSVVLKGSIIWINQSEDIHNTQILQYTVSDCPVNFNESHLTNFCLNNLSVINGCSITSASRKWNTDV